MNDMFACRLIKSKIPRRLLHIRQLALELTVHRAAKHYTYFTSFAMSSSNASATASPRVAIAVHMNCTREVLRWARWTKARMLFLLYQGKDR